ncbi:MAG TPA: DUF4159 domain-containing protein [Planctomycetaceae bacterium]|nr:DUF4159 domain-containing protein [Planctomycetaceae bacterium]
MIGHSWRRGIVLALTGSLLAPAAAVAQNQPEAGLSEEAVLRSIERAQKFLIRRQGGDGSWSAGQGGYGVGVSSLALLALINSGLTANDRNVQLGLDHLRSLPPPARTYELALMIMALADAKDGTRDTARLLALAQKLEDMQIKAGANTGSWAYTASDGVGGGFGDGDRSNAQYAVLGLHAAVQAGVPVSRATWERVRHHWTTQQSTDGGWAYAGGGNTNSTGSMTVAGIATLTIVNMMLRDDADVGPDGRPDCCGEQRADPHLDKGLRWLARRFDHRSNPGTGGRWYLYYLYGLERAGRLSGRRFFGEHDWYRAAASHVVPKQSVQGYFRGVGVMENDEVVGTSLSLLFLSKGLAPVLINKLDYGDGGNWNLHPHDVRNLVEHITGLEKWPRLLTSQVVDMSRLRGEPVAEAAAVLRQSPILYISGKDAPLPLLDEPQAAAILREYINQGGFIFAVANCEESSGFHDGLQELVRRMYPGENRELAPLPPGHEVYKAEYPLVASETPLWGVDFGCRTAIIYSPADVACYWERWMAQPPPNRHPELGKAVRRAMMVGVNVAAYATGREPPTKLGAEVLIRQDGDIPRGFLEIGKVVHGGGWNTAPQALRNLLLALNRTVGLAATTEDRRVALNSPDVFRYPVLYMHGRTRFQLQPDEIEQLRKYLERGGVLFADSCCGSKHFDESFRDFVRELSPGKPLARIPDDHEIMQLEPGFDIRRVERREPAAADPGAPLDRTVRRGPPFLEGIDLGGRYAVVYSKYDISCALERQASVACAGYPHEDAVKIAINVILYAMMQNPSAAE